MAGLHIADAQYGSLGYAGFADWSILEGRCTLAVLFEYAGTLGLVDLDHTDPANTARICGHHERRVW